MEAMIGAVMLEPSMREVGTVELNFDGSAADLEVSLSNYERESESILIILDSLPMADS